MERWFHTATIAAQLYNLQTLIINALSKKKVKPKSTLDFHPFVKKDGHTHGMKVTSKSISKLKMVFNAMCR